MNLVFKLRREREEKKIPLYFNKLKDFVREASKKRRRKLIEIQFDVEIPPLKKVRNMKSFETEAFIFQGIPKKLIVKKLIMSVDRSFSFYM